MNGSILNGFRKIPLSSNSHLAAPISINVPGCDADIVPHGQVSGDDVFLPGGVLIPLDVFFVVEQDIPFAITIDIPQRKSASDFNRIDLLLSPNESSSLCSD